MTIKTEENPNNNIQNINNTFEQQQILDNLKKDKGIDKYHIQKYYTNGTFWSGPIKNKNTL